MTNTTQVKAAIPRELKRRTFAALALREQRFNHWLRTQMETWLAQVESGEKERNDERLVGSQARR